MKSWRRQDFWIRSSAANVVLLEFLQRTRCQLTPRLISALCIRTACGTQKAPTLQPVCGAHILDHNILKIEGNIWYEGAQICPHQFCPDLNFSSGGTHGAVVANAGASEPPEPTQGPSASAPPFENRSCLTEPRHPCSPSIPQTPNQGPKSSQAITIKIQQNGTASFSTLSRLTSPKLEHLKHPSEKSINPSTDPGHGEQQTYPPPMSSLPPSPSGTTVPLPSPPRGGGTVTK